LEILRAKQVTRYPVGEWYLGALMTLGNKENPERLSQAAHSLRELLENIPKWNGIEIEDVNKTAYADSRSRVFRALTKCKNGDFSKGWKGEITPQLEELMADLEAYAKLNAGPGRQATTAQGIAKSNPLYEHTAEERQKTLIRELKKCGESFQNFAHHNYSSDREDAFLAALAKAEKLLVDIFNPSAVEVQLAIREVVKKDPDTLEKKNLDEIFALLDKRESDYDFFFRNLLGPKWVKPLDERGYFNRPPAVKAAGDGLVQLGPWPPLLYLVRVAGLAPEQAIAICRKIPLTDNSRVYAEILNITLAVPDVEMSTALADKINEGIETKYHLLGDGYHKLVARWASSDATTGAALDLVAKLLRFQPDPRQEEKRMRRETETTAWDTVLEPKPPFDLWEYHRVLSEGVIPLARRVPLETSLVLIDTLIHFLDLKVHNPERAIDEQKGDDYSSIWCKRVDGPIGEYVEPDEALIHAVTNACEECGRRNDPDLAGKIDAALKKSGWKIFERIRLHLYAKFPTLFQQQMRDEILSFPGYADDDYGRERAEMIREACRHFGASLLTPEEYNRIVEAILSGPDKEEFREHLGENFTEERFAGRRYWLHRQQLWPFESILHGVALLRFNEANGAVTEAASIDGYSPIDMGGVREITSASPTPTDELGAKSDDELIRFLNEWDRTSRDQGQWWVTIDREGLAGAFAKCVANQPDRFANWSEQWKKITRPIFLRAAVDAATMQIQAKNFRGLEGWFHLCHAVLAKDIPLDVDPKELSDESDTKPRWERVRYGVQAFAEACLMVDSGFPAPATPALAGIVKALCLGPDTTLDRGESIFRENGDPLGTVINNIRGRSLSRLADLVIWLRKNGTAEQAREAQKFVTAVLEQRFAGHPPLTDPERAYLAVFYGRLWHVDEEWAKAKFAQIFPTEPVDSWVATFGSYLRYSRAAGWLYDLIKGHYRLALDRIEMLREEEKKGNFSRDSALSALGQHLFLFYLWGRFPLEGDGSLLNQLLALETPKELGALLRNAGAILKNSPGMEPEVLARAAKFLEGRIAAAEARPPGETRKEFGGFYSWLNNDQFPAEWRLTMFLRILNLQNASDASSLYVDCLSSMLAGNVALVVECFSKLTERAKEPNFYIQADEGRAILTAGFASTDPKIVRNAETARENLVAAGRAEFLD
jgi:hypothetical protein